MRSYSLFWLVLLVLLSGCDSQQAQQNFKDLPNLLQPTTIPEAVGGGPDGEASGWQQIHPGLEWQQIQASDTTGASDKLVLVRIDPATTRIRVTYDWTNPGTVKEWAEALKPLVAINGGFFDKQGRATALVVNDGATHGASYDGFGGMFAVGLDGTVSIRPLRNQPYNPEEGLAQALQSTPMLLMPGGTVPAIEDNGDRARRTAIGIDRQGWLVIIISPQPAFTLQGLARWLQNSDLNLETALNLDGGSSTGIYLQNSDMTPLIVDSLVRVPSTIIVEKQQ